MDFVVHLIDFIRYSCVVLLICTIVFKVSEIYYSDYIWNYHIYHNFKPHNYKLSQNMFFWNRKNFFKSSRKLLFRCLETFRKNTVFWLRFKKFLDVFELLYQFHKYNNLTMNIYFSLFILYFYLRSWAMQVTYRLWIFFSIYKIFN